MSDNLLVQGGNFADFSGGDAGFLPTESRLEGRSISVISEEDTPKEVGALADKVRRFVQILPEGDSSAKTSREGTPQSIDEIVEAPILPIELDKVRADLSALLSIFGEELQALVEKTDRVYQASIACQSTIGSGEICFISGEEGIVHKGEDGSMQALVTVGHLGQGGFGKVYKVYDVNTGNVSALKIFHQNKMTDELDLAREMIEYEVENEPISGVQRFYEAHHMVKDLRSGKEEPVSWVMSQAYLSDAGKKVKGRKLHPVDNVIVLKELHGAVTGFTNLLRAFGRLHLDLRLENLFCMEDGEMVVGDLGDLVRVKNVEDWALSIREGTLHHSHTRGCNVQSDIEQLKNLKKWAAEVMEGKPSSIRRIAQLEEELQLTQSEVEDLSRGELSETIEAKFLAFTFEKYKKCAEKAAVFQLGVALHSLLFDEMEPYRIDPKSGYQLATKAKFPEVEERIKARLPENLELAHLLAQMVHPNLEKRPEAFAVQEALKRHIEESEDLWGDVVFS